MSDTLAGVPEFSQLRYAELSAGDRFEALVEPVSRTTSDALRGQVGASRAGEHAPPGVLALVTLRCLRRALAGIIPGGVLVRQRFVGHGLIPAAAEVAVELAISAQQRRPTGLFTTLTFALSSSARLAAVVEWTILERARDASGGVSARSRAKPASSPACVPVTPRDAGGPLPAVAHTVTGAEIDAYARLSGDFNPLHTDPAYAAAGPFGTVVAHGPIALQTVFEALTRWLDSNGLPPGALVDVAFRGPVRIGDTVTATAAPPGGHAGDVSVPFSCHTQRGDLVLEALLVVSRSLVGQRRETS